MEAYENGAIVYKVRMNFIQLWSLLDKDLVTTINEKTKNFIHLVYNYFHDNYKNDDKKLRDFSHEDPAWREGLEQEEGIMPLNERLIDYYRNNFYDTLREIKEH
jgi:hydroxymethylpyrimidine pyrophosphatase-like HAD family hydrolase